MGKTLLLTGGSGFLGKNILAALKSQGKYSLKAPPHKALDLTDPLEAARACRNVEVVIHAAGLVLSRVEQQKRPAEVLFQNLAATLNIAEAARLAKVKKLIFISSITAYGAASKSPLKEGDLWQSSPRGPNFSYGVSKRVMDAVASVYSAQYGINSCCVIFPNLYGPGDKFNFNPPPLVATAIKQLEAAKLSGQKIFYAGDNGHQRIDLLYIGDAAEALKRILALPKTPGLLNVGTGRSVKIAEVFNLIAGELGYTGRIVWKKSPLPAPDRCLDSGEMKKHLRWQPKTSLRQGIAASVKWYLKESKINQGKAK